MLLKSLRAPHAGCIFALFLGFWVSVAPVEAAVSVSGYCCVALWFDVDPPEPGQPFELDLGIIESPAGPISLESIAFGREETGWQQGSELGL